MKQHHNKIINMTTVTLRSSLRILQRSQGYSGSQFTRPNLKLSLTDWILDGCGYR
jgi:hypothetical protein